MGLYLGKQVFYNWLGVKLTATVSKIFTPISDTSDVSLHIRNPTIEEFNFQFIERVAYGVNTTNRWEYSPHEIDYEELVLPPDKGGTGTNTSPHPSQILFCPPNSSSYKPGNIRSSDSSLTVSHDSFGIIVNQAPKDIKQFHANATISTTSILYTTMTGMSLIASATSSCRYRVSCSFVVTSSGNNRAMSAAIFVNGVEDAVTTVTVRLSNVLDEIINIEKIYEHTGTPTTYEIRWKNGIANTLTSTTRSLILEQL